MLPPTEKNTEFYKATDALTGELLLAFHRDTNILHLLPLINQKKIIIEPLKS